MTVYVKDPGARVDYMIDWGAAYLGDHYIVQSVWSAAPDDDGSPLVDASSHDGRRTAVTLSGGAPGRTYDITNRVTLSNGEVAERSLTINVEQR
ncbi:MAG: hypothetical protein R3E02_06370 [Blastomonas sp.]